MKLILFDLDGTLVSTGGAGVRALDRAFLGLHRVPRACEGISLAGRTDPAIIKSVFKARLRRDSTPNEVDNLILSYLTVLAIELDTAEGYRIMEGMDVLLQRLALRADVFLALGTGNLEKGARLKLARAGFNGYFTVGGYGSDHEERPEVLRIGVKKAEAKAKCRFAPKDVLVVGDTVHDVTAGQAIGAVTVAMGTGHSPGEELRAARPDHFLSSFKDTEAFLRILDVPCPAAV